MHADDDVIDDISSGAQFSGVDDNTGHLVAAPVLSG